MSEGVVISDHQVSLVGTSPRAQSYRAKLLDFMQSHVYPAEADYSGQMRAAGNPHHHPQAIEDLKCEARRRGLWNLFHPHPQWGAGLSNLEYAPLAEIMGRSPWLAPEACNCNAPDTGNMEVLTLLVPMSTSADGSSRCWRARSVQRSR